MRRRTGVLLGGAAGLILASIAQAWFWYLPREQTGSLSSAASVIFAEDGWRRVIWVAHPHQNLARLQQRVGDFRAWWEFVRGGGEIAQELPSFGPFVVPPSTELVLAESDDGGIVAWMQVRRGAAVLARAAGSVARNPWLAGGSVRLNGGRSGRIRWQRDLWILEAGANGPPVGGPDGPRFQTPESRLLAAVALNRDAGRLPSGRYRLLRGQTGLELRLGPLFEPALFTVADDRVPLAAWLLEQQDERSAAALLVWAEPGPVPPFPSAATLARGDARMRLPGHELLRFAGRDPSGGRVAGFRIEAHGRPEAARASSIAVELERLLLEHPDLRLAAAADLGSLQAMTEELARRFRGLPVARLAGLDPEKTARILVSTEGCGVSRIEHRSDPERVRWWICPGSPAVPDR